MHWFAADERGLALGIRQAAIPIGGFAGAVALPALVAVGGVHAAFVALAVNALVWAVLAGVVLRERHVDEDIARAVRESAARPSDVAPLLRERVRPRRSARDHGLRRAVPARRARLLDSARSARARSRADRRRRRADRGRPPLRSRAPPRAALHQARAPRSRSRSQPPPRSSHGPIVVLVPVLVAPESSA